MTKKSRKSPTITGVDSSDFENFIQAGSNLSSNQNADTSISRKRVKSAKTEIVPLTNNQPRTTNGPFGSLGFAPRRNISKEERFERANLLDISQQDLDNLAGNFNQRKSEIIGRRQQPGRNQLILSRDNL